MYLRLALVLAGFDLCSSDGSPWTYHNQAQWPGGCLTGKRQSPINIETRKALVGFGEYIKSPLNFMGYSNVKLRGVNNGHTIKFNVEGEVSSRPMLSGGPLRRVYVLDHLHVHWPSEHSIDSIKYPMEIHFVHHRMDLSLEEAKHNTDGVAVVAVMCKMSTSNQYDKAFRDLVKFVPMLVNVSSQTEVKGKINLFNVLSPNLNSYYTYEGSLTTPDCNEVVTWIVCDHHLTITDKQYKEFTAVSIGGIANFRYLQPLNRRQVYRSPSSSAISTRPQDLLTSVGTASVVLFTILKNSFNAALSAKKKLLDFHRKKLQNVIS